IAIRKGFGRDNKPQPTAPDREAVVTVAIKELEPLEIHLPARDMESKEKLTGNKLTGRKFPTGTTWHGYLVENGVLKSLPTGSTMDTAKGVFYWQPGFGFYGTYRLVFISGETYEDMIFKHVTVTISAKF
ncbi:MAG: hypothetical protein GY757_27630, partial [bacterium]|nr:hypothetical protein [bacterium]